MSCQYHPDKPVFASCTECGALICEACAVELNERTLCKSCVERLYKEKRPARRRPESAPSDHFVSPFFVFIFSVLPGAAHMFMGLMKKGVFIMGAFFFTIASMSFFCTPSILGLLIPIIFFLSFFDAWNTQKKINRGEKVEDEINSIFDFIKAHKGIFTFLGIAAILMVISNVFRGLSYSVGFGGDRWIPLALIAAGIYFISRRKKDSPKPPKHSDDDDLGNGDGM